MSDALFRRILVPIADREDTEATCDALAGYLDESVERVTILNVIEQTEGYMDTASPEALQEEAERWFDIARDRLPVAVETELRAGPDVVAEILTCANEIGATAIVFRPRPKHKLSDLFSTSVEHRLLTNSPCPVIALSGGESETES